MILKPGLYDDRLGAGQFDHVGIRHPVGRGDDDLIAGVQRGLKQVIQAVLGAAGDEDLIGAVFEPVFTPELVADRLFQRGRAVNGRVFGLALFEGGDRGLLDVLRRVEIGFARAEADDVPSRGAQFGRAGRHRERGGRFDAGRALR